MPIKMMTGSIYQVKVMDIKFVKVVTKKDGKWNRYDITMTDRSGNTDTKEYLTKLGGALNEFHIGIFQYVKCTYTSEKGDEIIPHDIEMHPQTPPPSASQQTMKPHYVQSVGPVPDTAINQDPQAPNQHLLKLNGSLVLYVTSYVKDLKIAEMQHWGEGRKMTTDDIDDIMALSDYMINAIAERVNF